MKIKLTLLVAFILISGATVIVVRRQPSRHETTGELPQVMSNYQKTFKLDTTPAIFPDGKSTNSPAKTTNPKP